MRLDAVHIRPVHTVQVTDTDRKARYRNVEREIILHRKLIAGTKPNVQPRGPYLPLRQEIIQGFTL